MQTAAEAASRKLVDTAPISGHAPADADGRPDGRQQESSSWWKSGCQDEHNWQPSHWWERRPQVEEAQKAKKWKGWNQPPREWKDSPGSSMDHRAGPQRSEAAGSTTAAPSWTTKAPWLVASPCDGLGGAFACLDALKLPFHRIIAEQDHALREHSWAKNPHLRTLTDIAEMSCEKIVKEHEVKQTAGILLIGGPPCQPFSSAGKRQGFKDERATPCTIFCALNNELVV